MIDYIRDGQAIYRQSFATIRAEANLAGIPADLEKLAVRVIHACGMVDVVDDLRFSPDAGAAGSKEMLAADSRGVPYVIVRGRRGGSAMAAAAVNALATERE
ncbi:precorrin-8X methylmutase [Pseudomonas aeruginosa]|uniref:precorrin-8X methylmutase n=1 Tax=Pseudomonas aeruginosa TaxID=287 RepID=UPI0022719FB7|nr:precorrin-8X methylmutase [Pseudomonas aeruginosa]MCY0422620.1 precorrin-8X methylmutase [Pseudomonas aeruginosa]